MANGNENVQGADEISERKSRNENEFNLTFSFVNNCSKVVFEYLMDASKSKYHKLDCLSFHLVSCVCCSGSLRSSFESIFKLDEGRIDGLVVLVG